LIARVIEGEEAGTISSNELASQMLLLQNAGFDTTRCVVVALWVVGVINIGCLTVVQFVGC
jgi:cytochrome P450